MPLLNGQGGKGTPAQTTAPAGQKVDGAPAAGEKKESYWKRAAERSRQEKKTIIAFLEACGKPLSDDVKAIVEGWKNPARPGIAFGEPFFNKVFGAEPKVGDKVTLQDVFNKTAQGSGKMHSSIKRWAEKGIVVDYIPDEKEPVKSVYVIKEMKE